jgi:pyruvate-ferredoxin/flavodoxin oxidoreductase
MVCPHAAIRAKAYEADKLANAPISFKSTNSKDKDFANHNF